MANVQTQSLTTMLQNFAAAAQGACSSLLNFTIGTVLRAIGEAVASLGLWLQGMVLQILALTRAATSTGADLDTWLADFFFTRQQAVAASGPLTFSRFTPSQQAVVPVGSVVLTDDGSQQFTVVLDTTNAAYSAQLGGYVLPAGTASISATVQANTPGTGGNVAAGAISQLYQAIPGVDTVTNPAAFANGVDAESDAAVRARFQTYIANLSKATKAAIGEAIASVQQGLVYIILENQTYAGAAQNGTFIVIVDDGSGSPGSSLLSSVSNAIDAVRPLTSTFYVYGPVVVTATVSMTITTANGYTHSAVTAEVQAALLAYINTLPIGAELTYTRLAQVAYDASPGVTNVTGVTLNGGTADLPATSLQVIKATSNSVTVS